MLRKILFYYCFFLAMMIFVSGLLTSRTPVQVAFQFVFFPVVAYFCYQFLLQVRGKHVTMPFSSENKFKLLTAIGIVFLILFTFSVFAVVNTIP